MAIRDRPFLSNVVARLVVYYAVVNGAMVGIHSLFPMISVYILAERGRSVRTLSRGLDAVSIPGSVDIGVAELMEPGLLIPVAAAMIMSFALAVPVAWIYIWNRPQGRNVYGFAQTLVIVPLAISVVVFLVKGSLPLAFSLAGIVGVVRFRSDLEDSGDVVYLFIVISIGLAAGVQLLPVAAIGSMFFVLAQLVVGRTRVLPDDLVMIGWNLEKVAPLDVEQAGGVDPREATLRIHTTELVQALSAIAPILEAYTATFKHSLEEGGDPGVIVVRFDLRLLKKVNIRNVARRIEAAEIPGVTRVDVFPL